MKHSIQYVKLNKKIKIVRDKNVSRDDIEDRVEDILCVLDPDNKEIDDEQ